MPSTRRQLTHIQTEPYRRPAKESKAADRTEQSIEAPTQMADWANQSAGAPSVSRREPSPDPLALDNNDNAMITTESVEDIAMDDGNKTTATTTNPPAPAAAVHETPAATAFAPALPAPSQLSQSRHFHAATERPAQAKTRTATPATTCNKNVAPAVSRSQEYVKQARALAQEAHGLALAALAGNPLLSAAVKHLEAALKELAHPTGNNTKNMSSTRPISKPISQPRSWAQMAGAGVQQPHINLAPKTTTTKTALKPAPKPVKDNKIILVRNKDTPPPTQIDSRDLRNQINAQFTQPAVSGVELSEKGNIVITTTQNMTASALLAETEKWKGVFNHLPSSVAQRPEPWAKIVAKGVPVRDFAGPEGMDALAEELHTFYGIQVKGRPYWLGQPAEGQFSGAVAFAVGSEEERRKVLATGINVGGRKVHLQMYKPFGRRTQCTRCQGFGHNPNTCRLPLACRICGGHHRTLFHKCGQCHSNKECEHVALSCANCKGKHTADSTECETKKTLFRRL